MQRRPSIRQLEYVVAISEHGSFSHAARARGVTQPALSTQVRRLEESLGVALFERRRDGTVATIAGEGVIAMANACEQAIRRRPHHWFCWAQLWGANGRRP